MPLNWSMLVIILMVMSDKFWILNNQFMIYMKKVSLHMNTEFKNAVGALTHSSNVNLSIMMLFLVMLMNILGLVSYLFPSSGHLITPFSLVMPLWLGATIMSLTVQYKHMMSHLVPKSTPMTLAPFMVLIETISLMIRPLTLSVRLTANIIAGHLLMSLASAGNYLSWSNTRMLMVLLSLIMLCVLETAVSLIQSYVISLLLTLYLSEYNTKEMYKYK